MKVRVCNFVLVTQYKSRNTHAALAGDIEMAKRWFHQVLLLSLLALLVQKYKK